ncbi:MAG TPA: glycosyltransferase WbuB [Chloroflexi bacterium]|nr:glycosyltransferase WbuB [Chloroflexota bacterium]
MKILILTQWYPPEPALLLQELAQTLQEMDHQVTILTGFPNYPSGQLYPGYRLRFWQRENLAGVSVIRVPLYPDHSRSGARRVLNYLSFALSSAVLGSWLTPRPDAIFVYHPPLTVGLPAYVLSHLWRVPFVYQIQDMWPETLQATGMLNNERALGWVGRFAEWVYAHAGAVCTISPGFRDNLIQKGVPEDKIHVISNWVDTSTYRVVPPDPARAQALGMAGKFNIMFAGNIGEAQGLEVLVDAAALLQDLQPVQFVVVGDGVALPRLRKAVEARGLSNVLFLGRYPTSAMPGLYTLADVLLIHLKDDALFRITIPHKTFAYMASGKPILAAVAGDAVDVVTLAGAGVTCPPENPEALASTVRQLYQMPASKRRQMAERGLRAAQTTYSRKVVVAQIEQALRSAVQEHRCQKRYGLAGD